MKTFLNIIWHLPFLGFLFALFYAIIGAIYCITIVGIPVGLGLLQLSRFLLWPHGNVMVTRSEVHQLKGTQQNILWKIFTIIIRVLYFPVGLFTAICMIIVICFEFISLIGIPCGLVWAKSLGTIFNPVNKVCVPQCVAQAIQGNKDAKTMEKYAPRQKQGQQLVAEVAPNPATATQAQSTEESENRYTPKPAPEPRVLVTPPPVSASHEQAIASQPVVTQPVTSAPAVKKSQPLILWVGIALLLFAAGAAVYYIFIEPRNKTAAAGSSNTVRMYTYSGLNTNLRSSDDPNSAILTKLSYGVPLLVEKQMPGWIQVKYNTTTGYVSSDYLLPEDDYFLLNSIFGNSDAQACLDESRYRLALLKYFKDNRLYGDPSSRPDHSPFSEFQAGWQAYTLQKGSKPNTILFTGNKKYQDMAVIIRNKNTGKRKCLIFAFDRNEQPSLIHEEDAPLTGYIQDVVSQPDGTKRIIIY